MSFSPWKKWRSGKSQAAQQKQQLPAWRRWRKLNIELLEPRLAPTADLAAHATDHLYDLTPGGNLPLKVADDAANRLQIVDQQTAVTGTPLSAANITLTALAATGLDTHAASQLGMDAFAGQVVYLDLQGASGVRYNGPIQVSGIDVPAFQTPLQLRGQESQVVSSLLMTLRQDFAGTSIVLTTQQPPQGSAYSTVYLGGDGSPFAAYGFFFGLAEKTDIGNHDPRDNAFVFSDVIAPYAPTVSAFTQAIAPVVAHEVGHLLGFAHDHDHETRSVAEGPLDDVAWKPYTHIEIGKDHAGRQGVPCQPAHRGGAAEIPVLLPWRQCRPRWVPGHRHGPGGDPSHLVRALGGARF